MPRRKNNSMARPHAGPAAKKRDRPQPAESARFQLGIRLLTALSGPTGQQFMALALLLFGLLTIFTIAGLNSGALVNSWARLLVFLFGWGAYPSVCFVVVLALLWLRNLVHTPTAWRWRPFLGLELALVGMLALSHTLLRNQGWTLVESGQGGGIVGWALFVILTRYVASPLVTGFLLILMTGVGIALAFDLTREDLRALQERLIAAWEARLVVEKGEPSAESLGQGVMVSPIARRQRATTASTDASKDAREAPPASAHPQVRVMDSPPTSTSAPRNREGLPPFTLLQEALPFGMPQEEIRRKSLIIEQTLAQFGIPAEVTEVRPGPTVTQFGVTPGYVNRGGDGEEQRKVRVSQISALADDLALALAARSLRIEAPVPGRAVVGIEVPNQDIALVTLRYVLESKEAQRCQKPLCFAVGLDVAGSAVVGDLASMPHLLVAGTTGSGKSVFVKSLAASLIMHNSPEELKFVAIDPKMVELTRFNGLPHMLGSAETELERALKVLRWVVFEMDTRYKRFARIAARNLDDYNHKVARNSQTLASEGWVEEDIAPLPRIVVLIDELADLMMAAPEETERALTRIAQMARATGIHLVVATQRPSTDVVTGLIKANFPARISFATASQIDSRVILDTPGANTLLGRGDMLFLPPDASAPRRIQGCYVSDKELEALIQFWQREAGATPAKAPWETIGESQGPEQLRIEGESEDADYLEQAIALAQSWGEISTSSIQRRLRISYPRAARLMERMEEMGIVGPQEAAGRKRRVILGGEEDEP